MPLTGAAEPGSGGPAIRRRKSYFNVPPPNPELLLFTITGDHENDPFGFQKCSKKCFDILNDPEVLTDCVVECRNEYIKKKCTQECNEKITKIHPYEIADCMATCINGAFSKQASNGFVITAMIFMFYLIN